MLGRTTERLDRDECLKLMERHPSCVGRVALAGPRPVIFPVNYAIDRGNIVFRTDPGSKFHAAVHQSFVAFEVDWVEPSADHRGDAVFGGRPPRTYPVQTRGEIPSFL